MSTVNENGDLFDIPENLAARCMRLHGWSSGFTDKAIQGYRQFMKLKLQQEDWDATILSPSLTVDLVWHQHILDPAHYAQSCEDYANHMIGHDPDGGLDQTKRKERIENTKFFLRALHVRSLDKEVWSFAGDEEGRNVKKRRRRSPRIKLKENKPITIRVRDQDGEETYFKMKLTTKLRKMFDVYAARKEVRPDFLQFLLDGDRIESSQTPMTLELEDQDKIDCILNQAGC